MIYLLYVKNATKIKDLTLYTNVQTYTEILENYFKSLEGFSNKNFKFFDINNPPSDIKMFWLICYEPIVAFDCSIPIDKKMSWFVFEKEKMHLINAKLIKIKN